MLSSAVSGGVLGVDAFRVDVEVDVARALPSFSVVGLPDNAVKESKDRVKAAIKNSGHAFPAHRVTVNLAPADVKKEGAAYDLPMALAILATDSTLQLNGLDRVLVLGELSLDGSVRPVRGVLAIASEARRLGVPALCVPRKNATEAAVVPDLKVFAADTLGQVVEGLQRGTLERVTVDAAALFAARHADAVDLGEVRGQGHVKRALEVAAAGGHNLLMVGPPGSGKTMLARRLSTILPAMEWDEALETSRIYSVTGLTNGAAGPLVVHRPFRSPHHTISDAGLIGGGSTPRCGEISLAHNGVLFLDEMPEFKKHVLEVLRQPLEDGRVTIARAASSITFPARFMLVGAMNPCPCGYHGDPQHSCSCGPAEIRRYRGKVSGPLLDRFDLHVEVPAVRYREMVDPAAEETSEEVRGRVERAREVQVSRGRGSRSFCNAQLSPTAVRRHCAPEADAGAVLQHAMDRLGLSARAYTRALKVARTVADLEGELQVGRRHVLEALQFRRPALLDPLS